VIDDRLQRASEGVRARLLGGRRRPLRRVHAVERDRSGAAALAPQDGLGSTTLVNEGGGGGGAVGVIALRSHNLTVTGLVTPRRAPGRPADPVTHYPASSSNE